MEEAGWRTSPAVRLSFQGGKRNTLTPDYQPMNDPTSQAAETVNLFAADPSANGTVTAERRLVEQLTRQLGLDRAQTSAVHAVMTWAVFLRPSTDRDDREHLRNYLDVMGYLP